VTIPKEKDNLDPSATFVNHHSLTCSTIATAIVFALFNFFRQTKKFGIAFKSKKEQNLCLLTYYCFVFSIIYV